MVDISGLDKADVLAALYNASRPQGLGFLQAGFAGPLDMTHDEAATIIARNGERLDFDYVQGRPIKADLTGDEFDPWGFDRDQGQGAAERAVANLRQNGSVRQADGSSFADSTMTPEQARMYAAGALHPGAKRL